MTDYKTLSNTELNRLIAKRLGYHIIGEVTIGEVWIDRKPFGFPDEKGIVGVSREAKVMPNWAGDDAAAIRLNAGNDYNIGHYEIDNAWAYTAHKGHGAGGMKWYPSLSRALSEAWLMFMDGKDANNV